MKLTFNDAEYELDLHNTNFVDAWHSWLFDSNDSVFLIFDEPSLHSYSIRWAELTQKIIKILERVNEISNEEGLSSRWYYELSNNIDTDFLQKTHERWAQITKESWEQHLPIYNQQTKEIYDAVNKKLRVDSLTYNDINHAVHEIEFLYQFFMLHRVSIQKSLDGLASYQITHSDSSFTEDVISLPFNDIGRPQFEKYCISGRVADPEISNFANITNKLEFRSKAKSEVCLQSYIDECETFGVPVWGPYVPIAGSKVTNPQELGYTIIKNFSENKLNELLLRK